VTAKYAVINAEKANDPAAKMCRWLGATRSGLYELAGRLPSAAARPRDRIAALVGAVFEHSRGGESGGVRLVAKTMDGLGLVA